MHVQQKDCLASARVAVPLVCTHVSVRYRNLCHVGLVLLFAVRLTRDGPIMCLVGNGYAHNSQYHHAMLERSLIVE